MNKAFLFLSLCVALALADYPGITPQLNFNQGFDSYTMLYRNGTGDRESWGKSDIEAGLNDHQEQSEVEREWLAQKSVEPDERTIEALRSLGYTQ